MGLGVRRRGNSTEVLGLHARFDGVGGEENEVVCDACGGAGEELVVQRGGGGWAFG